MNVRKGMGIAGGVVLVAAMVATLPFVGCGGSGGDNGPAFVPDFGPAPDIGPGDAGHDTKTDSTIDANDSTVTTDTGTPDSGDGALDGDVGDADAGDTTLPTRLPPTNGSAIVLTHADDAIVVLDRDSTTKPVSVFDIDTSTSATPNLVSGRTLDTTSGVEPWQVVIDPAGDDTAYVTFRRTQEVVKISPLHGVTSLTVTGRVTTGSEPTGIAVSPTGASLYVANWAEGTVSIVKTSDMTITKTIDLNAALISSGLLGTSTSTPRPGLAHPRAVVVTNNGDTSDADETVFVTEFYAQARTTGLPADDTQFDLGRQGVVYAFSATGTGAPTTITLGPIADTGFKESTSTGTKSTGCFPNQLHAAAINNGRLYVTAVCTSPKGPVGWDYSTFSDPDRPDNFRTMMHASLFVIDVATKKEKTTEDIVLTKEFGKIYDAALLPTLDPSRRMPLVPVDVSFLTGSHAAYVAAEGSDAMFRIEFNADGSLLAVGATAKPFIQLEAPGASLSPCNVPVGVATPNHTVGAEPFMYVDCNYTRNVAIASATVQLVQRVVPLASEGTTAVDDGKRLFMTGLGRWSLEGQAWQSCASCHPDGLSDGVTWFFPRGPRQTPALAGVYDPNDPSHAKRKLLSWTASQDQVHDYESLTRHVSGGVGAIVAKTSLPVPLTGDRILFEEPQPFADGGTPPQELDGGIEAGAKLVTPPQNALNGSTQELMPSGTLTPKSILDDWNQIDAYVKSIRPPRSPIGLVAGDVSAGAALYVSGQCAACHGGPQWTLSNVFYTPGATNNDATNDTTGLLRTTTYFAPSTFPPILNPPTKNASRSAILRYLSGFPIGAASENDVALNDTIQCILRDVGTFPVAGTTGVAPTGVVVKEVRADMSSTAQGVLGFNPPSLFALSVGGPYYHAGNARTLEEVFDKTFVRHYQAHAATFLGDDATRDAQIAQLVAYLLSIDASTTPVDVPTAATLGYDVDLCSQTGGVVIP